MDAVITPILSSSFATKNQITAADIPLILDHYGDNIKVLSLDCFDTLLWRKTATPRDVFYDMQHRPLQQSLNVTAYQRIAAAIRAYREKSISHNSRQVSLHDIYYNFTSITTDQKNQLVDEEIQTEISLCYAFTPFVELIRQANQRGIKIVIVSDIYMTAAQLKTLLAAHLPPEILNAIDTIFCSLDYGKSKSDGIFQHVLETLAVSANTVLHIGDHFTADYESPKKFGIAALHFLQFNNGLTNFLRIQNSAASLAVLSQPAINYARQARYSPFRAIFSLHNPSASVAETLIGYMTFGPILYAFADFVVKEIEALQHTGKKIKPFFLLRDAYLLYKACEAYAGKTIGELARIRKFVAVAASFRTQADVDYYLSGIAPEHFNMWVICEQLLLPRELSLQIIELANRTPNPQESFYQIIHKNEILNVIFQHSTVARERLKKYLVNEMKIEAGDTLVLIDTGYIGVTQDFLKRALQDELKIEITGLYFISSHEPDRPSSKSLLTSSWCEHGLLEQSCTYKEGPVSGYDESGKPIFGELKLSHQQYEKVQAIQSETLRFIQDARKFFLNSTTTLSSEMLKKSAEAALIRQIFFPMPEEIHYFKDFQHDKDLGPDLKKTIYNTDHAALKLKHLSHSYKAHPYELRAVNLDKSLSLFLKRSFDVDFSPEENSYYQENLRVIAIKDAEHNQAIVRAIPTLDGYHSCFITVAANNFVGIVFGEQYQWVQIDKICLVNNLAENILDTPSKFILKDMKSNKSLFECESNNALLMLSPFDTNNHALTLQIIFRPLIRRENI